MMEKRQEVRILKKKKYLPKHKVKFDDHQNCFKANKIKEKTKDLEKNKKIIEL